MTLKVKVGTPIRYTTPGDPLGQDGVVLDDWGFAWLVYTEDSTEWLVESHELLEVHEVH